MEGAEIVYNRQAINDLVTKLRTCETTMVEELACLKAADGNMVAMLKGNTKTVYKERTDTIHQCFDNSIESLREIIEQTTVSNDAMTETDEAIAGKMG